MNGTSISLNQGREFLRRRIFAGNVPGERPAIPVHPYSRREGETPPSEKWIRQQKKGK